jgi:hypothetical protein
MLPTLIMLSGVAGALLAGLIIYGNTLDMHETEELYINREEEKLLGDDQKALVARMEGLKKVIFTLAVVTGVLIGSSAAIWMYIGFGLERLFSD